MQLASLASVPVHFTSCLVSQPRAASCCSFHSSCLPFAANSQQISDVNNCHSLMVVIAGLPFFFPVTSRPVRNGEELLLSYGPHYWTVRIGLLSCSEYFIATSSVSRTLGCEVLFVAFFDDGPGSQDRMVSCSPIFTVALIMGVACTCIQYKCCAAL